MSKQKPQRGAIGRAAETLKEALVAKLQPGVKDSPINDGLVQAINLVEAFLNSYRESPAELEALKAQVKRVMMSQVTARASPPPPMLRTPERRAQSAEGASSSPRNEADNAPRLNLYSRNSTRSTGSSQVDFTMPQRHLNRKAFLKGGDFGQMTLVQDDLARKAEMQRKADNEERKRNTLRMFDQQMALVNQQRAEEREARRRAQLEMDEHIRQYQLSEEERMRREREQQDSLRRFYEGQVEEQQTRKRMEEQQQARENEEERQQIWAEQKAEQRRLEQLAAENAASRQRIKTELHQALAAKAAARAAQLEEEKRYNKEYMAKMDADEAKRRRAVEMRQEKMRLAFERGGGVALQANLDEQARLDAERAERLAAEAEAAAAERERRQAEERRRKTEAAMRTLEEQIAEKEAERVRAAEESRRIQAELRAAQAAARVREAEEKAERRRQQAEARAAQKVAIVEEHRRRFEEYREPFDPKHRWLHAAPLAGTQRAFNNLAVPAGKAALLSSMQL